MPLSAFEGRDVVASGVEVPGASGGLNKALRVNELELHHGDVVTLALQVEVAKVKFDVVRDTQVLERNHVMKVLNAAVIDSETVSEALEAQRIKVEEAQGITRLPYDESADDADDVDDPDDDGTPDNVTNLG